MPITRAKATTADAVIAMTADPADRAPEAHALGGPVAVVTTGEVLAPDHAQIVQVEIAPEDHARAGLVDGAMTAAMIAVTTTGLRAKRRARRQQA